MAYSDYGGYAYRNGEHIEERSDVSVLSDGTLEGSPGMYPGFAAIAHGATAEEAQALTCAHVVLGTGPTYVLLRKHCASVYSGGEPVNIPEMTEFPNYEGGNEKVVFEVDGVKITLELREEDNYYIYAKVEEPDGTVWTGFSGYGVGSGLEDCGYGYSTEERISSLNKIFPVG